MVRIATIFSLGLVSFAAAVPLKRAVSNTVENAAIAYVAQQWDTNTWNLYFDPSASTTSSSGALAIVRQITNDQPVWNSAANVQFNSNNQVISFTSKHFDITYVEDNMPTIMVDQAVSAGEQALDATWTDTNFQYTEPDHLGYIVVGSRAKYEYILHFQSNTDGTPLTAYISAVNGEIDWVVNTNTGATISSVSA